MGKPIYIMEDNGGGLYLWDGDRQIGYGGLENVCKGCAIPDMIAMYEGDTEDWTTEQITTDPSDHPETKIIAEMEDPERGIIIYPRRCGYTGKHYLGI